MSFNPLNSRWFFFFTYVFLKGMFVLAYGLYAWAAFASLWQVIQCSGAPVLCALPEPFLLSDFSHYSCRTFALPEPLFWSDFSYRTSGLAEPFLLSDYSCRTLVLPEPLLWSDFSHYLTGLGRTFGLPEPELSLLSDLTGRTSGLAKAQAYLHIGRLVDPYDVSPPHLRFLERLHAHMLVEWNNVAQQPAQLIAIPKKAHMSLRSTSVQEYHEILVGKEWSTHLDRNALKHIILRSYKLGIPVGGWAVASADEDFLIGLREDLTSPAFKEALGEVPWGLEPKCSELQRIVGAGGKVHYKLWFRPPLQAVEVPSITGGRPLAELSWIQTFRFYALPVLEQLQNVKPYTMVKVQAPSLPEGTVFFNIGFKEVVEGAPQLRSPVAASPGLGQGLGPVLDAGGSPLRGMGGPLFTAWEGKAQGLPWALPPKPAFWRIYDNYYYEWLASGMAQGVPHGIYYYLVQLFYFEPFPLSMRSVVLATDVSAFFKYPFRDVVLLRSDVIAHCQSQHFFNLGDSGRSSHPTEALCTGRLGFYGEAAAGLREYFGWGLRYNAHSDFLLRTRTVPLECTPPWDLTWAQESTLFGAQGHWSPQRWLWWHDVVGYRLLVYGCTAYEVGWALASFFFQSFLVLLCWCHDWILWFFWMLYYGFQCAGALLGALAGLFLKLFYVSYGLVAGLLTLLVAASGYVATLLGTGASFLGPWLHHLFWFLEGDGRLAVGALVHVLEAFVWALAQAFYGLGPGYLALVFFAWCYSWLALFKAGLLALCLGYYNLVVVGLKGALLALCLGYYNLVVVGLKGALGFVGWAWAFPVQAWSLGCAAFYGLFQLAFGVLQCFYSTAVSVALLAFRVVAYFLRFWAGGPLPCFLSLCFFLTFGSGLYGLYRLAVERPFQRRLRHLVLEKFYRKFFRDFLDKWCSQGLWWFLRVERHVLQEETVFSSFRGLLKEETIFSGRSSALKLYVRLLAQTTLQASRYSFCLALGWARRQLLVWLAHSPFAYFLSPFIFFLQLRALGLKMQWDVVDYAFAWRLMDVLRAAYFALVNVDMFWSFIATFKLPGYSPPPVDEVPEKSAVAPGDGGFFFASIVSFFRPAYWDYQATFQELGLQPVKTKFLNLLAGVFLEVFYYLVLVCVGGLCVVIPSLLRFHFFYVQWRLRWLNFFVWLESRPATVYVLAWVRRLLAWGLSGLPRAGLRRLGLGVLGPCYEGLCLVLFVLACVPRIALVLLQCIFYLALRGRWGILLLVCVFSMGATTLTTVLFSALEFWALYSIDTLAALFWGDIGGSYLGAKLSAGQEGAYYLGASAEWKKTWKGFCGRWILVDLVAKVKALPEGASYLVAWGFYWLVGQLPPQFFYVYGFAYYYIIVGVQYSLEVISPWFTNYFGRLLFGDSHWTTLLGCRAKSFQCLGAVARPVLEGLGQGLEAAAFQAWGLVPKAWESWLFQNDTFLYGRWLWYYSFWDFFNYDVLRQPVERLYRYWPPILKSLALQLCAAAERSLGTTAVLLVERVADVLWLDFSAFWGLGSDLLSAYSFKYKLWGEWRLFFDGLCVHYKLKPLQLRKELVPLAEHNLVLEDFFYNYWRSYNKKNSLLVFLHEPYVVWNMRHASAGLPLTLATDTSTSRGSKKVTFGVLALGLSYLGLWFTLLLLTFKGLRQVLWVSASEPYSSAYEWTSFRQHPEAKAFEALVRVPSFMVESYEDELGPQKGWQFSNLARLSLEDWYGTQDPVKALDLFLAQAGGQRIQRVAAQVHLKRAWASADREALWSYVFGRDCPPGVAFGDERLRFQARKLFSRPLCRFLKKHSFDFLSWFLDPEKAAVTANFIGSDSRKEMRFLLGYLYRQDSRIARIAVNDDVEDLEPVELGYARFIDKHRGPLEQVYAYYAWVDSFFFGDRLPSWVCHKDTLDSFYHEDLAYARERALAKAAGAEQPRKEGDLAEPPDRRFFVSADEEPGLQTTLNCWLIWAPLCLFFWWYHLSFGLLEGTLPVRLELRDLLMPLGWHFKLLEPIYSFFGAESFSNHSAYVPNSPYYKEMGLQQDTLKLRRIFYSWDHVRALGSYYLGTYLGPEAWWQKCLNYGSDWRPHWALFGGRAGYRYLAALMLLVLGYNLLRVLVPALVARALGRRLEGPEPSPGQVPGGLALAPEYRLLWERRSPWWGGFQWKERLAASSFQRFLFWREQQLQRVRKPLATAQLYVTPLGPQRLRFRSFAGLKFYYALKAHARVGIVAHGKKGYGLRTPRKQRLQGWWRKTKGL